MRLFITGLAGTLGTAVAQVHHERGDFVFGCSRNEGACIDWRKRWQGDAPATLLTGDASCLIRPETEIGSFLHGPERIDVVYHLAAMKHVDLCEKQPMEAVRQNVDLTAVVAGACARAGVPMVFASSDKACLPQGVYGATKLLGEKIVLSMRGAVVRLGNLIGSSGSVFHVWKGALERDEDITLTDPNMTRYFLPVEEAARFLIDSTIPGRVCIPHPLKAARMGDVASRLLKMTVGGEGAINVIGPRPGETTHQWLVAPGERVLVHHGMGRLTLDEDGVPTSGLCSNTAVRLDSLKLLEAAGICG